MFKIVRIPAGISRFFRSLTTEFHWEHAAYFRSLVFVIAFAWGRRNITNLYRHLDAGQHRTRFNNFLHAGRFDERALLMRKAYELLGRIKLRKGAVIHLILDDSKRAKRGKHMDAVGFVRDCATGRTVPGHQYVTAILKAGDVVIPFGIDLYVKKAQCPDLGIPFRKTTQMAADFVRAFEAPPGVKVVVLFDSYYLCKRVVAACRDKGFHFVSALKDNRNLWKRGRKLKTGKYKKNAYRCGKKQIVTLAKRHGAPARFSCVDAGWLQVSDLGSLHVVFTRKNTERRLLGVVTDDPDMTVPDICRSYSERWTTEVFYKDAKQLLGLGQYQNRSYRAAVIHLHLVCFAYALLTHLRLDKAARAKGKHKKQAARMSTAEAQNELRRLVWKDLVQYLEDQPTVESFVKELNRLLATA